MIYDARAMNANFLSLQVTVFRSGTTPEISQGVIALS